MQVVDLRNAGDIGRGQGTHAIKAAVEHWGYLAEKLEISVKHMTESYLT